MLFYHLSFIIRQYNRFTRGLLSTISLYKYFEKSTNGELYNIVSILITMYLGGEILILDVLHIVQH